MTAETPEAETSETPESSAAASPQWRPSRRAKITALVLAVLVVVGVTGGIVVVNHNADAPVAVVREYVEAIARGDATTANRLSDPRGFGKGVDPALLTDEVLRSAKQRIKVEKVDLYKGDLSSDVVEVQVEYSLGERYGATVILRAQRSGTTAGVFHEWRVIDPLLTLVQVEVSEPLLDTASLGAATVPAGGRGGDWPARRAYVYPGVYELRGHESRYLTTRPQTVVAVHDGYDQRPSDAEEAARGSLVYQATPELTGIVADRLAKYVTACAAAAPKVPANCPEPLLLRADYASDIRVAHQPRIESIQSYQTEPGEPSLRMIANSGSFSYRSAGRLEFEDFRAYAWITVTPADDLTITFTVRL